MQIVSSREFRNQQAHLFGLADAGESVVIKRRNKPSYMLVKVEEDEFILSPSAMERIEKARKDYEEGRFVAFDKAEDAMNFLESL